MSGRTFISRSPSQTRQIAKKIFKYCLGRRKDPLILALSGELGAGKTLFTQGLASALGVRARIKSPTFALVKSYALPKRRAVPFDTVIHIDAYRLNSVKELRAAGFAQILRRKGALAVIEWADRIRPAIPKNALWIRFSHGATKNERRIRIEV